jgi:hypothetical protein
MSAVAFRVIVPLPPQPLQRPVDLMRLVELRARVVAAIADIDRLVEMRSRSIERRSAASAVDQRPVGVPIEYHAAGRVLGVR